MPFPKERLTEFDSSDIPEIYGKPEKSSPYHRSSLT